MAAPGEQEDTIGLWLNKATDPGNSGENWESIHRLCNLINEDSEGPLIACRVLAHKIQSPQEPEALQALTVLETCINNCGTAFHHEVGKYRFLNELIKVLSPKYLGIWSADSVKDRIVEIFYSWTVWFPEENKIRNAYQMLKKNGIIKKDPKLLGDKLLPPPSPRAKDSIFDDEEKSQMLARLLKSSHPEDLQAANRLIKSLIKEEQEKTDKNCRRIAAINDVQQQTQLLVDMLSKYPSRGCTPSDREDVQSQYERCEKLRPTLFRLASDTVDNDEALAEVLRVNDHLTRELSQYQRIMGGCSDTGSTVAPLTNGPNIAEPLSPESNQRYRLIDLSEIETKDPPELPSTSPQLPSIPSVSLRKEDFLSIALEDSPTFERALFDAVPVQPTMQNGLHYAQNSSQSTPMEVIQVVGSKNDLSKDLKVDFGMSTALIPLPSPSLNSWLGNFSAVKTSPLETLSPGVEMLSFTKKVPSRPESPDQQPVPALPSVTTPNASFDRLSVPLDSIKPSTISPVIVHDKNGMKVMLHVSSESVPGQPDVTVLVLSMLSTAPQPIHHIMFQAAVPKSMKVKLQPASGSELPPFNPLLPPVVLSQVLLLLNPQKNPVRLRYKLTFTQAGRTSNEVGEIHSSPDATVWEKI